MIRYPHRVYLVALASDPTARPWVVGMCQMFGDGGEADADSCQTELASAADPTGPVVGHALSTPLGDDTLAALLAEADAGRVPAGVVWAVTDLGGIVTRTNHPDPEVLGMQWDMAGALHRTGLAFRVVGV